MKPEYYKGQEGMDVIDCIKILDLNFNLGNVLKYCKRTGQKTVDKLEDLRKAEEYLKREIAYEEQNQWNMKE